MQKDRKYAPAKLLKYYKLQKNQNDMKLVVIVLTCHAIHSSLVRSGNV